MANPVFRWLFSAQREASRPRWRSAPVTGLPDQGSPRPGHVRNTVARHCLHQKHFCLLVYHICEAFSASDSLDFFALVAITFRIGATFARIRTLLIGSCSAPMLCFCSKLLSGGEVVGGREGGREGGERLDGGEGTLPGLRR